METFLDIIAAFDKAAKKQPAHGLDRQLGVGEGTVAVWKHRKRIPPKYWPELVGAAKTAGIKGISASSLLKVAGKPVAVDARGEAAA